MRSVATPTALCRLLLLLVLLAGAGQARAQEAAPTDVILRTDGREVPGRVLTISPLALTYLPPTGTDTLRLANADVFLVRYANGTHEVLNPMTSTDESLAPDLLPGLSDAQRRAQGRQDAARSYTSSGPFWGSLSAGLYGGPLLGLIAPATVAPHSIARANLNAPHPELLADPAYGRAYREEAQRRKRGRAWGGYGVGMGAWLVLVSSLVSGL